MRADKIFEQFLTALHLVVYLIRSKHRKGHGIHSPFVYEFVSRVIFDGNRYPEYEVITAIRNKLKRSGEKIRVADVGSLSMHFSDEHRSVVRLVSRSSVNRKTGNLLFRISRYYKPELIVELGTSIGMSAIYLATGNQDSKVITLEGNASLAAFAKELFRKNNIFNIELREGLFDDQLLSLEKEYPSPGLIFIDGNHSYEATLEYYRHFSQSRQKGMLIFDDINWSTGMRKAWHEIKVDDKATVTIDLFRIGIVILNDSITAGHYIIRF
jgi:predicted O-methyltransferase YrrM